MKSRWVIVGGCGVMPSERSRLHPFLIIFLIVFVWSASSHTIYFGQEKRWQKPNKIIVSSVSLLPDISSFDVLGANIMPALSQIVPPSIANPFCTFRFRISYS